MADEKPNTKNYITPDGMAALQAEFHQLYKVERPQVVRDVSWAAGNGDRSENGDYIYGKRRLRQIDSRCRFLMKRMDIAEVADSAKQQHLEKIYFGAWVTLFNLLDETEVTYRIVGQDELEPSKGFISWISPLAKAMLGKEMGSIIKVETPEHEASYEVIEIRY